MRNETTNTKGETMKTKQAQALTDQDANHFEKYETMVADYMARLAACDHSPKDFTVVCGGLEATYCLACSQATRSMGDAVRLEHKRARKAQLAEMARCEVEGCNHRATLKTYGALLCGRHFKSVKREHCRATAGAGILGMLCPIPYTTEDILEMAKR